MTSNECKVHKYSRVLIACSCQDKNENQSFGSFWMHDERTDPSMYRSTEAWFVRHRLYPEQTKGGNYSNWRRGSMSLKSPWALEGSFQVPIFRQRKIKTSRHHTAKKTVEERLTSVYSQTQAKPVAGRKKALFTFKATSQVSRKNQNHPHSAF